MQWSKQVDDLTRERSVWGRDSKREKEQWMLDYIEGRCRMHKKLRWNHQMDQQQYRPKVQRSDVAKLCEGVASGRGPNANTYSPSDVSVLMALDHGSVSTVNSVVSPTTDRLLMDDASGVDQLQNIIKKSKFNRQDCNETAW